MMELSRELIMSLFIAFLIGGISALLLPGTTRKAAENAQSIRQWLVRTFPSLLSRILLLAVAAGICIAALGLLHFTHRAGEAVAFLLAILLGHLITDYLINPGEQSDTARLILLGGTAGLLIVLSIFPPDYLRRSLTRFNIGGISVELLQAAPPPPIDLPGATLVQSQEHHEREVGLTSVRNIADRLQSFDHFAALVEGRRPADLDGYPTEAVKEVFLKILLPFAHCAGKVREATVSTNPDLVFDITLAQAIVNPLHRASQNKKGRVELLGWVRSDSAKESWQRIVEGWNTYVRSSEAATDATSPQAELSTKCADPAAFAGMVEAASGHFQNFDSEGLQSLHYPFFVAGVLASRGDFAGAAEAVANWLNWFATDPDANRDVLRHKLTLFYSLRALTVFLQGDMSEATDEGVQQRELIARERAILATLSDLFEHMRRLRPELTLPDLALLGDASTPFSDLTPCAFEEVLVALRNEEGWKRPGEGAEVDRILGTAQYLTRSYLEATNSLLYRSFSERGGDEAQVDDLIAVSSDTLRRANFTCLPSAARAYFALALADTLIAPQLLRAREQVWQDPLAARDRVCSILDLAVPTRHALSQYRTESAEPTAATEGATLSQAMDRHGADQQERLLVNTVIADLRALERSAAGLAGDPSLDLKEAKARACQ